MAVAWPKRYKTHNLPRLFGLQKVRAAQTFFIPAIFHVTRLLRRPNHAKMAVAWPKTVKKHNLPRLIWAAKSSRGANFLHPSHFSGYTSFTAPQPRKSGRCLAKNSQNTHSLPRLIWPAKSSRGAKFFHPQPFPTIHFPYGVTTLQKWPLPGQKQSKHTICHV